MKFSDAEIDQLLASVEDAMAQASKLAKSQPMYKDAEEEQQAPAADDQEMQESPAQEDQAADSAPEMDEQPEDQGADDQAESPESEMQEGAQDQDEISDEELHEIYASMDENELHRHLAAIEAALGGGQDQEQSMQSPESAAQSAPQQEAMQQAPAMAMKSEAKSADLKKSEEFKKLQDENDQLKKSLDKVIAAMGKAFQPTRKAVTNIEYIKKSESQPDEQPLSKAEMIAKLNKLVVSANLSKSDRQAINNYILTGGSEDQVKTILKGEK